MFVFVLSSLKECIKTMKKKHYSIHYNYKTLQIFNIIKVLKVLTLRDTRRCVVPIIEHWWVLIWSPALRSCAAASSYRPRLPWQLKLKPRPSPSANFTVASLVTSKHTLHRDTGCVRGAWVNVWGLANRHCPFLRLPAGPAFCLLSVPPTHPRGPPLRSALLRGNGARATFPCATALHSTITAAPEQEIPQVIHAAYCFLSARFHSLAPTLPFGCS